MVTVIRAHPQPAPIRPRDRLSRAPSRPARADEEQTGRERCAGFLVVESVSPGAAGWLRRGSITQASGDGRRTRRVASFVFLVVDTIVVLVEGAPHGFDGVALQAGPDVGVHVRGDVDLGVPE